MQHKFARVAGTSGGKDSTAVYLMLLEKEKEFDPVYADTGFEAPETYEYVNTLHEKTGGPKVRVIRADLTKDVLRKRENLPRKWSEAGISDKKIAEALEVMHPTGNAFLDLCLSRGGFPSPRMRYCTHKLKLEPFSEQVYAPLLDKGFTPVSYQGLRAEESSARAKRSTRGKFDVYGAQYRVILPILRWTTAQVMHMLARHSVQPNPLYHKGFERVGCFPCIHARKSDIAAMAKHYPEAIERVVKMEELINHATRGGDATLLPGGNVNKARPIHYTTHGIRAQIDWARTTRGGKQYNLLEKVMEHQSESEQEWRTSCSEFGVCE